MPTVNRFIFPGAVFGGIAGAGVGYAQNEELPKSKKSPWYTIGGGLAGATLGGLAGKRFGEAVDRAKKPLTGPVFKERPRPQAGSSPKQNTSQAKARRADDSANTDWTYARKDPDHYQRYYSNRTNAYEERRRAYFKKQRSGDPSGADFTSQRKPGQSSNGGSRRWGGINSEHIRGSRRSDKYADFSQRQDDFTGHRTWKERKDEYADYAGQERRGEAWKKEKADRDRFKRSWEDFSRKWEETFRGGSQSNAGGGYRQSAGGRGRTSTSGSSWESIFEEWGLPKDADPATARKKYRDLAKQFHPDLNPNDPSVIERMKKINAQRDRLKEMGKVARILGFHKHQKTASFWDVASGKRLRAIEAYMQKGTPYSETLRKQILKQVPGSPTSLENVIKQYSINPWETFYKIEKDKTLAARAAIAMPVVGPLGYLSIKTNK